MRNLQEEALQAQRNAVPGQIPSAQVPNSQPGTDLWSGLGAGGYSALNELGLGLPDFLVKNVGGSDAYQKIKALQAANPMASTVGGVAGGLGSLLIPGMGAAKGASALARGAELAAKQAIPRALTGVGTDISTGQAPGQLDLSKLPESLKERAGEAGLGIAGGALLNPAAEKLGQIAMGLGKGAGSQAVKTYLGGSGIQEGDIAKGLGYGAPKGGTTGTLSKYGEEYKRNLANYMKQEGVDSHASMGQYLNKVSEEMKPVVELWNAQAPSPRFLSNFWQKAIRDPRYSKMSPGSAAPLLESAMDNAGNVGKFWDVESALSKNVDDLTKVLEQAPARGQEAIQEADATLRFARDLHKEFMDYALARPDLKNLAPEIRKSMEAAQTNRDNWQFYKAIQSAHARGALETTALAPGAGGGAINITSNPALARTIGGAALGGAAGGLAGTGSEDPTQKLGLTLGGMALGGVAPNVAGNLMQKLATGAAGKFLPKAAEGATVQPYTGAIQNLPPAPGSPQAMLSQIGKAAPGAAPAMAVGGPAPSPAPASGPPVAQVKGMPIGVTTSQAPISMGGESVKLPGQPQISMDSMAGKRIVDNLNRIYEMYKPTNNGQPMSKQDFLNYAFQSSDGFAVEKLGNLITSDSAERQMLGQNLPRLKALSDAQRMDLNKLVDIASNVNPTDTKAQQANSTFVQLLAKLGTKDPADTPSARDIQVAQDSINRVRNRYDLDNEQKKQMMLDLLKEKGFPLSQLKGMGLTQGTQLEGYN